MEKTSSFFKPATTTDERLGAEVPLHGSATCWSQNLGTEVTKGMRQKAAQGGAPGRASQRVSQPVPD